MSATLKGGLDVQTHWMPHLITQRPIREKVGFEP